jgi:hypothetical protein
MCSHSSSGTRWRSWLRHYATSRNVAGPSPDKNYAVRKGSLSGPQGRRLSEIFWSTEEAAQEPKERTWGNSGSRKILTVACNKMTRRAGVAWRKWNVVRKDSTRDKVERGSRRVRTPQQRRLGIKYVGGRRPLYLRKERTTTGGIWRWSSRERSYPGSGWTLKNTLYEIVSVKIANQIAVSHVAS